MVRLGPDSSFFVLLDDQIARISRMKASIFFVIRARSGARFCSRQIPLKNVTIKQVGARGAESRILGLPGWCENAGEYRITDGEHLTPRRSARGYYLLSARNILNGRIDLSDVDYVGEDEYQRIRRRCNPEAGDVLT